MIYKRILALITVILLVAAIFLVKKKAKNPVSKEKVKTEVDK